jgi:hypothetical protein
VIFLSMKLLKRAGWDAKKKNVMLSEVEASLLRK